MCGTRVSSDTSTMEVVIDAIFIQVVDTLADIGTLLKQECRGRIQAEERAETIGQHLGVARRLLEQRALVISRLEATWREHAFARNVHMERADKLEMELASIDSTLDEIEGDLGIVRSEGKPTTRRERLRALVIAMTALRERQRPSPTPPDSDANSSSNPG
jgi:hypothetical protein